MENKLKVYIALLRGINVGGKGTLPMTSLVQLFKSMGSEDVSTYIQSGNVVFKSKQSTTDIAKTLRVKILEKHGFEPKTMILELPELQAAIKNNPFPTEDGKALHFYFLDAQPKQPDLEGLLAVKMKSEEFKLGKKVFYLCAPEGIGRSKLAAKVEQCLGVAATARNWNTVSKLMEMGKE